MLAAARSLEGELALRQERTDDACKSSGAAVALLEKYGDMPIVRTEEVLWRHSRCLAAAGDSAADDFRAKAVAVVERKANSLGSDEAKQRMLSSTPVGRALGL